MKKREMLGAKLYRLYYSWYILYIHTLRMEDIIHKKLLVDLLRASFSKSHTTLQGKKAIWEQLSH